MAYHTDHYGSRCLRDLSELTPIQSKTSSRNNILFDIYQLMPLLD
jgi:hypothetical protein